MRNKSIILPKDKFDLEICKNLQNLSDELFFEATSELLTWLQDGNWPIFHEMIKLFIAKQDIAMDEISKVFNTNNVIWQYWILSELYPRLTAKNKMLINKQLEKCFNKLSLKEEKDEDDMNVIELLHFILNKKI